MTVSSPTTSKATERSCMKLGIYRTRQQLKQQFWALIPDQGRTCLRQVILAAWPLVPEKGYPNRGLAFSQVPRSKQAKNRTG